MRVLLSFVIVLMAWDQCLAVKDSCPLPVTPVYNMDELKEVNQWFAGKAFADVAKSIGYEFDYEAHIADNPNDQLFQFGLVTAEDCLELEVTSAYDETLNELLTLARDSKDVESFKKIFLELAAERGFDVYLIPPGVMV